MLTDGEETPPINITLLAGFSLEEIASKVSEGMGTDRAFENKELHKLELTNPGSWPHGLKSLPDCVRFGVDKKS